MVLSPPVGSTRGEADLGAGDRRAPPREEARAVCEGIKGRRLAKQSRQKTGRPAVGRNGIWVVTPHSEHTTECISRLPAALAPRAPPPGFSWRPARAPSRPGPLLRASRQLRQR